MKKLPGPGVLVLVKNSFLALIRLLTRRWEQGLLVVLMRNHLTSLLRFGVMLLALGALGLGAGCATSPKPVSGGKLFHVGLVWLKEPGNAAHRQQIVAAAHAFAREIPEVQFLSVGQSPPSPHPMVDDSFDVCVVMQFADKAAMDRYNQHPVHQKAANEAFLPLSKKILFYDFKSE